MTASAPAVAGATAAEKERGYDGRLLVGHPPRVVSGVSQIYFRSAAPYIEDVAVCPQCKRNEIVEDQGKLRCSHCPWVYDPEPDITSDNSFWDETGKYRPFVRSEWEEVFLHHDDDGRLVVNSQPYPQTQLPPAQLKNATDYQMFYIQDINKKSHSKNRGDWAKFEKNLQKFKKKMGGVWAARKSLYLAGEELLSKAGFNRHTESVGGLADPVSIGNRFSCPRCGCSFFEEWDCYDCGFDFRQYARKLNLQKENGGGEELIVTESPTVKHRVSGQDFVSFLLADGRFGDILDARELQKLALAEKPQMPKSLFPIALLIDGRFKNLVDPEKVRNLAGVYAQLVGGWLDRDVVNLLENDGRAETVRKRARRFLQDFKEYLELNGEFLGGQVEFVSAESVPGGVPGGAPDATGNGPDGGNAPVA